MIGLHDCSFDSYNIADIIFLEDLILFFAHLIFTNIDLDLPIHILDVHKAGFPLTAFGHDTTGDLHMNIQLLQLFFGHVFILCRNLS